MIPFEGLLPYGIMFAVCKDFYFAPETRY
ncbi:unnamed protein product [Kuraishia capsulata CBS 1993]|uniref:Uncharacterized protein n=1 Tax=Kuraishia capsulata CBS 1993 TaxID=1382522 RepID=W6MW12_9ASCO|nr:unnamed protein product [Kuraishia capsulata CBS 1993]